MIERAEALADRARDLEAHGLNGLELVVVRLDPPAAPTRALLDVYFHNTLGVADIVADTADPRTLFPIAGGHRIRAGAEVGQVQAVAVAAGPEARAVRVTVEPIGDYSTYELSVQFAGIDPLFSSVGFKFRPGCFRTDCDPSPGAPPPETDPAIDYLAKDYESFRHTLITALRRRVPGWEPTSDVDLSMVLVDQLAAAADELSDFQDRAVAERSIATARKRLSLARHARLMDYHIHQGNQAHTWLALEVVAGTDTVIPAGLVAATADGAQAFVSRDARRVLAALDQVRLYTWSDARPGLARGSTSADLAMPSPAVAADVAAAVNAGDVAQLLFYEALDPATGSPSGADPRKRQIVALLPSATAAADPFTGADYVRVHWRAADALTADYCATAFPPGAPPVPGATLVCGNLVEVFHGARQHLVFVEPGDDPLAPGELPYRQTRWGALCELPPDLALAYRDTAPGGEVPPRSTMSVEVHTDAGSESWHEVISLVQARAEDRSFAVDTDELGRSALRFGNGVNGASLPARARVECHFQSGAPLAGNVGAGAVSVCPEPLVERCWNPLDVTSARAPEPAAQVVRFAPEAYRSRQLRAVTLADYVDRAEEFDGVSRAAARYAWTGSWRTVRVVIDPVGSEVLDDELRRRVAEHLEAVRLIGEDLEIRGPRFVPLDIHVVACVRPDTWVEHVRHAILDELSDGYTAGGRRGLFHPDSWSFGQSLHASEVIGRVQGVEGVEHVVSVDLARYRAPTPGPGDRIQVAPTEIIQVHNDPDDMERGVIQLELRGGRQ